VLVATEVQQVPQGVQVLLVLISLQRAAVAAYVNTVVVIVVMAAQVFQDQQNCIVTKQVIAAQLD
jgi:hypothetical protein